MEARRKSSHCTKVSLKLKELMMNKSIFKNPDKLTEQITSKTPPKSISAKSSSTIKYQTKQSHPTKYNYTTKWNIIDNKENLSKNQPSLEEFTSKSKEKNSQSKISVESKHKKIHSLCGNTSIMLEQVTFYHSAKM